MMAVADRAVRARTRAGRLNAVQAWLALHEPWLLEVRERRAVIDVGFGETPVTTVELAQWCERNASLHVTGLERDEGRVTAARAHAGERLQFVHGGFEAVTALGPAALVRAMNVLRAYREDEVPAIHEALGAPLVEGGLLIEGTSDTDGHVLCAHVFRMKNRVLVHEGLLLFTDAERGFAPMMYRDWLPRDLRRRVLPGAPIRALLDSWTACTTDVRAGRSVKEAFCASAERLAARHPEFQVDVSLAGHGFVYVRASMREGLP